MDILDICLELNNFDGNEGIGFYIDDTLVGICPQTMLELAEFPLEIRNGNIHLEKGKSDELEELLLKLKDRNLFPCLDGWRGERYSVYGEKEVLLEIERSACSLFGVRTYGCHLNGYSLKEGKLELWISKRSLTKSTYPGMLDQLVAGGLTAKSTPLQTMLKECYEEAGISDEFLADINAAGSICFWNKPDPQKIQAATNYVYDLLLPTNFIPKNIDKEVDSFYLMSTGQVLRELKQGKFKPDASIVLIDFLVRHGIIDNTERGYTKICALLHRHLPFPDPIY